MSLPRLSPAFLPHPLPAPGPLILQIGTGALLRGLVASIVDTQNQTAASPTGIVAVSSTRSRRSQWLQEQGGLFTLRVEGYAQGAVQQSHTLNTAIRQAMPAAEDWPAVLDLARQPALVAVVSNTTEVGIRYEPEPLFDRPPATFPGKLTALLYARYQALGGDMDRGLVILPCELLEDNGERLRQCVHQHVLDHRLDPGFRRWLDEACLFPNTLVDRIVTGTPSGAAYEQLSQELGYEDHLLTVTEPYALWAIEGDEALARRLPFAGHPAVVVAPAITPFRERKLRILNGTHTLMVALGYLSGLDTVAACTQDPEMGAFLAHLMEAEIVPTLPAGVPGGAAFAAEVLDRFRNPFLAHQLLDISLQYSSKMQMRNVATFQRYAQLRGEAPRAMSLGFAAFLAFSRPVAEEGGKWYGQRGHERYQLRDDQAPAWAQRWATYAGGDPTTWVAGVLADTSLWGTDLSQLPGLTAQVSSYLRLILEQGARAALAAWR